jgi:hypothetical protein
MSSLLLGSWFFVQLIYNGQVISPPNPNLEITYTFSDDGTNRLHYDHIGEKGSCDRLAVYQYDGRNLTQQITWVAPHNADFCSNDPDMQLGAISKTPAVVRDDQLFLTLSMGEESIVYVWNKKAK